MCTMYILINLIAALGALGMASSAAAAEAAPPAEQATAPTHVTATVHVASAAADSVDLVWRFQPADKWYLYAPYRNDTGFPPSVDLELPAGWTAGPLRFPVPERKVLPGEILDHVYPHELLVTQTLRGGGPAAPGGKIKAKLYWLACKDLCVPGQATLEIPIDVPADPGARELWDRARSQQPRPLAGGVVRSERDAAAIRLTVPGARSLVFIPAEGGPALANLLRDGAAERDLLELRLRPTAPADEALSGLLKITYQDGRAISGTILIP